MSYANRVTYANDPSATPKPSAHTHDASTGVHPTSAEQTKPTLPGRRQKLTTTPVATVATAATVATPVVKATTTTTTTKTTMRKTTSKSQNSPTNKRKGGDSRVTAPSASSQSSSPWPSSSLSSSSFGALKGPRGKKRKMEKRKKTIKSKFSNPLLFGQVGSELPSCQFHPYFFF